MLAETIKQNLRRRPFVPFRIEKTGGLWYEVHNPAMASATREALELAFPVENGMQRFVAIAMIHVQSVEIFLPIPNA